MSQLTKIVLGGLIFFMYLSFLHAYYILKQRKVMCKSDQPIDDNDIEDFCIAINSSHNFL